MYSRAQKRIAPNNRNPLQQPDPLQRVLEYVGPGHWCLVAEVSSLWRDMYAKVPSSEVHVIDFNNKITCVPQMTMFSTMFASPSRVRHAHAHDLDYLTVAYERAAGQYADITTLDAARKLGMYCSYELMVGAARCNELAVVQYLRAYCSWNTEVFDLAAGRGHTAMCAFLHAESCPWNARACSAAARNGHCSTLR
jgi:hypothetical protein